MNKKDYLRRIGIEDADIFANLETLKLLQKQHLLHVPFENLDIHWKKTIVLSANNFYEKIVGNERGGFCYELNGLFYELLAEIGFQSKIISARVSNGESFGAEYDHLAILTKVADEEFLVDVGFGDFTAAPLKFVLDVEQADENGVFAIRRFDDNYFEVVKKDVEMWRSEYIFRDFARALPDFSEMCDFHQNSPESHFTRGKICSLMTRSGRITLTDDKFLETTNGEKSETHISSEKEFAACLEREFRIRKIF